MHITEKGNVKIMKPAPKLDCVPMTRSFICALLRRAADKTNFVHTDDIQTRIEERAEALKKQSVSDNKYLQDSYSKICSDVRDFESASGIKISGKWFSDSKEIGHIVSKIVNGDIPNYHKRISDLTNNLKRMYETALEQSELIYKIDLSISTPIPKEGENNKIK